MNEVRPRVHAINVLRLKSKKERRQYLDEQVPEKYKNWVMDYVRCWWDNRETILREIDNAGIKT